jgi:hypothetical protein
MKKTTLILVLILCGAFINSANAQWKTMQYTQHGLSFKVPTGFTITTNDGDGFVANGANFTMEIYPWQDASVTKPIDIAQAMYDKMNATDKTIVAESEITVSDFSAYKVIGTGTQDGKVLVFALGGYLNPNSATNFQVLCTFWYDESTYDVNFAAADYILSSFKSI